MQDKRPVNLDMATIKLPLPALVSILTRVSGVFLFVGMAVLLYMLDASLASESSFEGLRLTLAMVPAKLLIWAVVSVLIYHVAAGVRHLLADLGIGVTLRGGILGARLTLSAAALGIVLAGLWIW